MTQMTATNDLIVLHVTVQDLDIICRSLAEQPYKIVHGVIEKLVNQANGGAIAPGTPLPPTGPLGEPAVAGLPPGATLTQAVPEGVSPLSGVAQATAAAATSPG